MKALLLLGELGYRFRQSEVIPAIDYCNRMASEDRIIEISKDGNHYAILFYSMTDDIKPFLEKGTWDFREHNPQATIIYVEKLVARRWTKELRRDFEAMITAKYPQIEQAIWHRWGKTSDRQVIYRRNLSNV